MTVIRRPDLHFEDLPGRTSADSLSGIESTSTVRTVRLEPAAGRTAHRHPHSEEIVLVTQGTGVVWVDGNRLRVEAGDLVHIPAGAAHATVPDSDSTMELTCFFPHPDLSENYEETDIDVTTEDP